MRFKTLKRLKTAKLKIHGLKDDTQVVVVKDQSTNYPTVVAADHMLPLQQGTTEFTLPYYDYMIRAIHMEYQVIETGILVNCDTEITLAMLEDSVYLYKI